MKNSNKELYDAIMDDIDPFSDSRIGFTMTEAVPGGGKTTFLINTIKALYGKYITKQDQQIYKQGNDTVIIPAGEGNEAFEDEETFKAKTNNKQDIYYINEKLRVAFLAFNTKIIKEISNKIDKIELLVGNKKNPENGYVAKDISIKTSHGLLFKMANLLNLFSNELQTDYTKGAFTAADMEIVFKNMQYDLSDKNFASSYQSILTKPHEKLNRIFLEIVNAYYETTILFKGRRTYHKLVEQAQENLQHKGIDIMIKDYLFNIFSIDATAEIESSHKISFLEYFVKVFLISMKKLILNGEISVGHSYYYKVVYSNCINNQDNLLKLFSIGNNPQKYFNALFVDEAQDLTPIMIELLIAYYKYAQKKGLEVSIALVGDSNQALYSFAQRENAFKVIIDRIGRENIRFINKNKTYRLPYSICNFINNCSVELYENFTKKLIPFFEDKKGFVYDEQIELESFISFMIKTNKTAIIIGRSNIELASAYIKTFKYLSDINKEYAKKIKIDTKTKTDIKNFAKKGINFITDKQLKSKIIKTIGKKNISAIELSNAEDISSLLPAHIKGLVSLFSQYGEEIVNSAISQRSSSKNTISFLTAHAAKGLEEEYVYVLDGIYSALFPKDGYESELEKEIHSITKELDASEERKNVPAKISEEEANIAYVAFSRAKNGLFLDKNLLSRFHPHIDNSQSIEVLSDIKQAIVKTQTPDVIEEPKQSIKQRTLF